MRRRHGQRAAAAGGSRWQATATQLTAGLAASCCLPAACCYLLPLTRLRLQLLLLLLSAARLLPRTVFTKVCVWSLSSRFSSTPHLAIRRNRLK